MGWDRHRRRADDGVADGIEVSLFGWHWRGVRWWIVKKRRLYLQMVKCKWRTSPSRSSQMVLDAMRGRPDRKCHFGIPWKMHGFLDELNVFQPDTCLFSVQFRINFPFEAFPLQPPCGGDWREGCQSADGSMHDARCKGAEKPPDLLGRCMLPNDIAAPPAPPGGP